MHKIAHKPVNNAKIPVFYLDIGVRLYYNVMSVRLINCISLKTKRMYIERNY